MWMRGEESGMDRVYEFGFEGDGRERERDVESLRMLGKGKEMDEV